MEPLRAGQAQRHVRGSPRGRHGAGVTGRWHDGLFAVERPRHQGVGRSGASLFTGTYFITHSAHSPINNGLFDIVNFAVVYFDAIDMF